MMFTPVFLFQTVFIKLVSPQAAQLGFHLYTKDKLCTSTRDLFKDILLRRKREKSPAPSGNRTHDLSVTRPALYRSATTFALLF